MLDLQAIFTGCIKTNVNTQPLKEIHWKIQEGISLWFRETFEGKKKHRGITSVVDSFQLSLTPFVSSPPASSTLHFKHTHSEGTLCWLTSHISIILKAVAAQAAAPANDYLLKFVTPVKLELQSSAFSPQLPPTLITCFWRKVHEPPSYFPSSFCRCLQYSPFFSFHSPVLISL